MGRSVERSQPDRPDIVIALSQSATNSPPSVVSGGESAVPGCQKEKGQSDEDRVEITGCDQLGCADGV